MEVTKLEKKYVSELIYKLLEKGYSKEVILFYITSTVDTNLDLDTIHRLYKLTKMKWLKAKYNIFIFFSFQLYSINYICFFKFY